MCGIAGIFAKGTISDNDVEFVRTMNSIQAHRGPDDEGLFFDKKCVLGHRRLSIIDLSRGGHQPYESCDKRYQLVFNGEIYNYIELRAELEAKGVAFRTQTDTEVLLKCFIQYGPDCLKRFNGMFAFVIYDTRQNTLFMARDRFGIKPLYYALREDKLIFASEIKALLAIDDIKATLNHQTLFDYLVFNRTDIYDETFHREIQRLPKGHLAKYADNDLSIRCWWNPKDYVDQRKDQPLDEVAKDIENILISSVKLRLRSDVALGSCLSGGLDSTILLGLLFQHHNAEKKNYKTFTASFGQHPLDETKYIDQLNDRYPFENERTFPSASAAFADLEQFVYTNDEPTTSASAYSQYRVMKLAKSKGITVLLDGQGADESFAGYHYFHGFYLYGLWRAGKKRLFLKELLSTVLRGQDKTAYQILAFQMLNDHKRKSMLYKTKDFVNKDFFDHHIKNSRIYNEFFQANGLNQSLMQHFQYKLEHLLRMEDRNSMAFSIEARVPYLDYRLVEYVLGVNEQYKVKAGEVKTLQKRALGQYTTEQILSRKDKLGFSTPTSEWMADERWSQLTVRSFDQLKKTYPEVFNKAAVLPGSAVERWKINQLNTWQNLFLKGD